MKKFFKEQFTFTTVQVVTMGLLIALEVVLNRFASINLWNLKIGFAFLPIMLAGMLMGPVKSGLVAVISDLVGAILFPSAAFFPGFTLSALIRGVAYGALLYKKQGIINIAIASAFNQFVIGLFITSLWISIMYGSPYWPIVVSRIVQVVPLFAVELVLGSILSKVLVERLKPIMEEGSNIGKKRIV